MKKFLTILMAFALLLAVISNTMAYSEKENTSEEPPVHGYPIGTKSEQDGTLIDDGESNRGLPFSMTATGVQHFLTTDYENSTKHFTGGAFDGYVGEGLLITGSLTHTGGSVVRFGACYYNPSNDTYYTVQPMIAYSGSSISRFISIPIRNTDHHTRPGTCKQNAVCVQHILDFVLLALSISYLLYPF